MTNKQQVPDHQALSAVGELCELKSPYADFRQSEALFLAAMREIVAWHRDRSPFYQKLLARAQIDPNHFSSVESLPFIPAEFFKRNEVLSVPQKDVFLHLTSSGTTGQKSQMFFDAWSIGSAQGMVDAVFAANGWISAAPCNYLLYSYQTEANSRLGTSYTDNFLCKYAPPHRVEYALKLTGSGGHDFDVFGCIRALQDFAKEGLPVRIFGFPAFLHFTLERMIALGFEKLRLSPDSLVFFGGGWKGHADKSIPKTSFYPLAEEWLGIPNERLRDGFGSVEHCVPYVECKNHNFHVPVWSRVIIRDLRTLRPLPPGQAGFLQFVSPYITSVPAHSVLMGDLAKWHEAGSCSCGLPTPWFEVLGRAGTSKNKSCAVAAADLLRRSI